MGREQIAAVAAAMGDIYREEPEATDESVAESILGMLSLDDLLALIREAGHDVRRVDLGTGENWIIIPKTSAPNESTTEGGST